MAVGGDVGLQHVGRIPSRRNAKAQGVAEKRRVCSMPERARGEELARASWALMSSPKVSTAAVVEQALQPLQGAVLPFGVAPQAIVWNATPQHQQAVAPARAFSLRCSSLWRTLISL